MSSRTIFICDVCEQELAEGESVGMDFASVHGPRSWRRELLDICKACIDGGITLARVREILEKQVTPSGAPR